MSNYKTQTYTEIAMTLIGPVRAIGDHGRDALRLDNLNEMIEVAYSLVTEIEYAAKTANRAEASMKAIGQRAQSAIDDLRESLNDNRPVVEG